MRRTIAGVISILILRAPMAHAATGWPTAPAPADTPLRLIGVPEAKGTLTLSEVGGGVVEIINLAGAAATPSASVRAATGPATPPGTVKRTIGGLDGYNVFPAIARDGNLTIYPEHRLTPGHSYAAKITGAAAEVPPWTFSIKPAPDLATGKLTVAADGSADFCTVQGAIDAVPEGNTQPFTIFIRNGTYDEIIAFTNKNNLTLTGESRKGVIIQYPNNDRFNNGSHGNPFATNTPPAAQGRGGSVYRRGMFLAHRVKDLTITNLTLHNTTPVGGSQAEAIILNGTQDAHAILAHCDLYSYQDTLQINGQAYLQDCYIEGDVDFMWGTGPCFFEACTAHSTRSKAYYTQIRNPPSNHGYVFHKCTFDGADGVTDNFLSRIDPSRFTASEVVLLDCTLTAAVGKTAWKFDKATDPAQVHYWEYNSHAPDGNPVDVSARLPAAKQLTLPADKDTLDNYANPTWVLNGWTPKVPHS